MKKKVETLNLDSELLKPTKRKLDKNKIYAFIGRVVVYGTVYIASIAFGYWAFCQNTIY